MWVEEMKPETIWQLWTTFLISFCHPTLQGYTAKSLVWGHKLSSEMAAKAIRLSPPI